MFEIKEKVVLILSGGLDSTTLLYDIRKEFDVHCLTFNYGQKHWKEIYAALIITGKLRVKHKVFEVPQLGALLGGNALTSPDIEVPEGHYEEENMKATVVPNRNMIFLSLAIGYAISIGAKKVFYAAHSGDHAIYPDCRPAFLKAITAVAKVADWKPVEVVAPYLNIDKGEILKQGLKLGVDYALTWTCYKGLSEPCGKCGACVERAEAFKAVFAGDPLLEVE